MNHVLQALRFVALAHQSVELDPDLGLAGGGHFVMMYFGDQPHLFHAQTHGRANILLRIHRWHREIAALESGAMAEVAALVNPFGVPAGFGGIDLIETAADVRAPANVVEDEEFVFRPEERRVADTRRFQVSLGTTGQRTRVALITLHGVGLDHIASQDQGRLFEERIDAGGHRIGHQNHVRFLDALPTGDGRTVEHFAVLEHIFIHGADGHGDMLLLATGVRESIIHELDALFLDQLHHISSIHCH